MQAGQALSAYLNQFTSSGMRDLPPEVQALLQIIRSPQINAEQEIDMDDVIQSGEEIPCAALQVGDVFLRFTVPMLYDPWLRRQARLHKNYVENKLCEMPEGVLNLPEHAKSGRRRLYVSKLQPNLATASSMGRLKFVHASSHGRKGPVNVPAHLQHLQIPMESRRSPENRHDPKAVMVAWNNPKNPLSDTPTLDASITITMPHCETVIWIGKASVTDTRRVYLLGKNFTEEMHQTSTSGPGRHSSPMVMPTDTITRGMRGQILQTASST